MEVVLVLVILQAGRVGAWPWPARGRRGRGRGSWCRVERGGAHPRTGAGGREHREVGGCSTCSSPVVGHTDLPLTTLHTPAPTTGRCKVEIVDVV